MSSIVIQGDTSGSITVEAPSVAGTHTLTLPKATGNIATDATVGLGTKNLIINGDMRIDQRATSVTSSAYTVDRWGYYGNLASKATVAQSSTAPTGYTNSLLATSSSAYSVAATDIFVLRQYIEGNNIAHLNWGTANAKTVTLSFWVRSSLTGTFGGVLKNAAEDRCYPYSYTINSANTWEQKSITIAGDTTGTWGTGNGSGIQLTFGLGVGTTYSGTAGAWSGTNYLASATGATSVVGTSGATFYITAVQLEQSENATPFEQRMYSQELAMCQRYFQSFGGSNVAETVGQGTSFSTISTYVLIHLLQTMRSVPSLGYSAVGDWRLHYPGVTGQEATAMSIATNDSNNTKVIVNTTTATNASMGGGKCIQLTADSTISARLTFSAEL